MTWLQDLEVGSQCVVVSKVDGHKRNRICTVMRKNKEEGWVVVDYHRYNISDAQGPTYRKSDHYHLEPLTQEWQERFDNACAKFVAVLALPVFRVSNLLS